MRGAAILRPGSHQPVSQNADHSPDLPEHGALLAAVPLFQELSATQLAVIASGTRLLNVARGELLFCKGDPPRGFFVVVRGQIKLAISTAQGQEKVIEVIGPRQSFGEAVMFMDRPYPVFAEALLDSVVLQVAREPVLQLLERDAGFARAMLAGLSRRLHSLVEDVEAYSVRSGAQRVIGYLLQHCSSTPRAHGEVAVLELPVSKQILASRLNLTPETLSRVFHALAGAGLIKVQGRQITILDLLRLRDYEI